MKENKKDFLILKTGWNEAVREVLNILDKKYSKYKNMYSVKQDIKKLLDLAYENAKIYLTEKEQELNQNEEKREEAINELKKLLNVKEVRRMESFDNSHLFGTYYVGGMVVFEDFLPKRDEYRKYKIDVNTKDDLSAMREVVYRRYYRLFMDNAKLPDLIVVDGGELQVKAVRDIIDDLNLPINIIGLKKDSHHKTSVIIDKDLNEIKIDSHSNLFLYLANIQEEVHRFAITYHRTIKNKGMLSSILEMVPGVGEERRKALLKEFSSLKKIKEASISELEKVLPHDVAVNLYNYLKTK